MKKQVVFYTVLLLLFFSNANASGAVELNEHGWLFRLSRYNDWKGKAARCQNLNQTQMAVVSCKGNTSRFGITSPKLERDLAETKLPDWKYGEITLPAIIPQGVTASTLQVISKRNNKMLRHTFIMHGPDGVMRKYSNRSLYTKEPALGSLKFPELKNFYFSLRTSTDSDFQFGDLQMKLQGKAALTAVPVVDAAAVDNVPTENEWKNTPVFSNFRNTLKAPASVKFLHDAKCIYIRVEQTGDTAKLVSKQSRDGQIWRDDSIQILLSPGNDNRSYHQFVVNSEGAYQSYHDVFDQVADSYVRRTNLREDEWRVEVDKTHQSWRATFTIQKTMLDKHSAESIHGLQVFVDNRASKGGKAFLSETGRISNLREAAVLRLLSSGQPLSKPFPEKPALFFHQGKLLTGVPGDFEFRLACPTAKITGKGIKSRNFYFSKNYTGSSGSQRFTIYNDLTGCIFAGRTDTLHWNPEIPYGSRVLVPEPKKYIWSKEKLSDTKLICFYPEKMDKVMPERIAKIWKGFLQSDIICQTADLPENTIVIGKHPEPSELKKITHDEGYFLSVSEKGVTIQGKDPSGLGHGISTLEQLARYTMLRNESFLPGITISDWPDIPNRYLHRWLDACYWRPKKELKPHADTFDEIKESMYDLAYRFCILNKFNHLGLRNPSQVIYETPVGKRLNRSTSHLSWKEMSDYAAFCRKHGLDIIPVMPSCSHANYLITNNFPEMILAGYGRGDADPEHPEFWKYLHAARGEWIDKITPKYFDTCNDEWWHYPKKKVELTQNGRPRREIFRETILKEHKFLSERNVRMMMYSDMLQPNHNGGKPFDNYLNLDKLPRDIIMVNWSGNEAGVKLFTDLGYTVWGVFNQSSMGKLDPAKIGKNPKFEGMGCILYGSHCDPEETYGSHSIITTAEEAWNFYSKKHTTMNDWLNEKGSAVMPMYSIRPNPAAGRSFKPVPLTASKPLSAPFDAVPGGKHTIGFIPMELSAGLGIKTGTEPVVVNINAKASALIFLQSELVTAKPPIINSRQSRWLNGIKSAVYTIHYADGKSLDIYARHAVNVGSALPRRTNSASEIQNRYLHDVRCLWQLKNSNKPFYLYQWEWCNPRPDVEINSISIRNLGKIVPGIEHFLFALTLRDLK